MQNRIKPFLILAVCMLIVFLAACSKSSPAASQNPSGSPAASAGTSPSKPPEASSKPVQSKTWPQPPDMKMDPNKSYSAEFITSKGNFTVQLFAKEAPKTVNNFVFLANEGFYNGVPVHRIIKNYMFQTGDPTGTGTGSPGYKFADEKTGFDYDPGTLAMANEGKPSTNGSQFFVVTGPEAAFLNQKQAYTIFGKVTEGMETVLKINETPLDIDPKSNDASNGTASKPKEKITIESVKITEK